MQKKNKELFTDISENRMAISFIENVEELILSNLHSSPSVINDVLKIINDDSSNVNDLVKILEHDPPITAAILKIANSAYYSPSTPIDSLSRAIVALGFVAIRNIAASTSVIPYFHNSKNSAGIDLPGLWLHSMGTARAAQMIAENIHCENQGIAFITGLLHDIGKIIIWVYFPEYFYQISELTTHNKIRSILAERKVLNTDHCMIGKVLCDHWNLPTNISIAIAHHHEPREVDKNEQTLARIIELSDYMCRDAKIGYPGDEVRPKLSRATTALLGTPKDKFKERYNSILEKLVEQKPEIEAIMSSLNS